LTSIDFDRLFADSNEHNFRSKSKQMLPANILFSQNPDPDLSHFLIERKYSKVAVLTDENTKKHCLPLLNNALAGFEVIEIRSGEEQKTLQTCSLIWQEMTEMTLDRHAAVVVLGGGVLGDMGGFCAATYKRGIDFVLIPTTLLSQVDASIGGKLGIDFNSFKNHIGVFQQPALTLLHSGFLKTLPVAELRSGFAEVIKHCLISDRRMFREISGRGLADQNWDVLIRHSVEFKTRVTTEDPKEKGLRKILNAGHTIGHAVESFLLSTGKKILHGEAIAIGLIAEAYIAAKRNLLAEGELTEIVHFIKSIFGKSIFGKALLTEGEIIESAGFTLQDKKNRNNKILCVLLNGIGQCKWDQEISLNEVKEGLQYYNSL
jgi:3-dehydroquinate synthase